MLLGLLNYYGKFIPNLSTMVHPLNTLLQANREWIWSRPSFQQAKDTLISARVLTHYDPSLPINLAADASSYGIGAVISHVFSDGTEKPFASRSLSSSEKILRANRKRGFGPDFWSEVPPDLYGRKFNLVTVGCGSLAAMGNSLIGIQL